MAVLLPPIHLILWYKVSLVTTRLLLLLRVCFELYPILNGTLLASFLIVILARMLVPALELPGNDLHADQLSSLLNRVQGEVLVVSYTAVEGS